MEIRNHTPFEDGLAIGPGPEGAACLAVILKATFVIPKKHHAPVERAEEQQPILTAEEYHDGDVTGSLKFERDNVAFKPRADVALVGSAYAPGGQPKPEVDVLLEVGPLRKALRVFGDRQWRFPSRAVMVPIITRPEPFSTMPLLYERAFGGFDRESGKWFARNHVGKGFLGKKTRDSVDQRWLPNIEDPTRLITSWNDEPAPVGFGFYNPAWQPRVAYAGTDAGQADPHPVFGLPADFQSDFFNGAHPDLQVPGYLHGNEKVELINLTPDGLRRFQLPGVDPVITLHVDGDTAGTDEPVSEEYTLDALLDTVVFLPDEGVYYQVWRGTYPLPDDMDAGLLAIRAIDIGLADG